MKKNVIWMAALMLMIGGMSTAQEPEKQDSTTKETPVLPAPVKTPVPEDPAIPEDPVSPEDPTTPEDPATPEDPVTPEDPAPETPDQVNAPE